MFQADDCSMCPSNFTGLLCDSCAGGHVNYPVCRRCDTAVDCSGHADVVTADVPAQRCVCSCRNQWDGLACGTCPSYFDPARDCGACATGRIQYPHCSLCDMSSCKGHSVAITTDAAQTRCVCDCLNQYTGDECSTCPPQYSGTLCGECATGRIQYSSVSGEGCRLCTLPGDCSAHANLVTVDLAQSACVCDCRNRWRESDCSLCETRYDASADCGSCSAGRILFPQCELCTVAGDCSSNAASVATDVNMTQCVCNCSDQWTGARCEVCPSVFGGSDCNQCAPGRIQYGDGCTVLCTSEQHCNGRAAHVSTDAQQLQCLCTCEGRWAPDSCAYCPAQYNEQCDGCAAGISDDQWPKCTQCPKSLPLADILHPGNCLPCPDGLVCNGTALTKVQKQFWRHIEYVDRGQSGLDLLEPVRCPQWHQCLGTDPQNDSSCLVGSTGLLCGECWSGWERTRTGCRECGSDAVSAVITAAVILGGMLVLLVFMYFKRPQTVQERARCVLLFKEFATYLQMLGIVRFLGVDFGVMLDISSAADQSSTIYPIPAALRCLFHGDFTLAYLTYVWAGMPFMLVLPAAAGAGWALWWVKRARQQNSVASPRSPDSDPGDDPTVQALCSACEDWGDYRCQHCSRSWCVLCRTVCEYSEHELQKQPLLRSEGGRVVDFWPMFLAAYIFLMFLAFSPLLFSLAAPFTCVSVDMSDGSTRRVVASDPRLECSSTLRTVCLCFFALYGVGVPAAVVVLLKRRHDCLHRRQCILTLSFLYGNYRRRRYWYEAVVLLRKSCLLLAVTVLPEPEDRVYAVLWVLCASVVISFALQPYRDVQQRILANTSLCVVVGTVCSALGVVLHEEHVQPLVVISATANCVCVSVFVYAIAKAAPEHPQIRSFLMKPFLAPIRKRLLAVDQAITEGIKGQLAFSPISSHKADVEWGISKEELRPMLERNLGKPLTKAEVQEIFSEIDADGSGVVTLQEVIDWQMRKAGNAPRDRGASRPPGVDIAVGPDADTDPVVPIRSAPPTPPSEVVRSRPPSAALQRYAPDAYPTQNIASHPVVSWRALDTDAVFRDPAASAPHRWTRRLQSAPPKPTLPAESCVPLLPPPRMQGYQPTLRTQLLPSSSVPLVNALR